MKRLAPTTLGQLDAGVALPRYSSETLRPGILHLGVGAFHRAHQAMYTDTALGLSGGDWGIIGASLRSDSVAQQLNPQGGLYTLRSEDASGQQLRLIACLQEVLVASRDGERLHQLIADPAIRVVTLTVTEKGYCIGRDGWSLDRERAEIQADLAAPDAPRSAIGILARGLELRYSQGGAPLTIISCDNLSENSARLQRVLREYMEQCYPGTLQWLSAAVRFPSSMVDRIVPAMNDAALAEQAQLIGLEDAAAVITEPFSQWIIEDNFADAIPDWQGAGALLVEDIRPYESLKLGLLNASHSAIAYTGLLLDQACVADVIADPVPKQFIDRLMRDELIPALSPPAGFDVEQYAQQLLQRFANPCLHHRCAQIAMDGTEKIRQRWLPALQQQAGDSLLLRALAIWCYYVLQTELPIEDPRQDSLLALRAQPDSLAERLPGLLNCLLGDLASAPDWQPRVSLLTQYCQQIGEGKLSELLSGPGGQ